VNEVLQFSRESNVDVVALCDIWKQQRETAAAKVAKFGSAQPKLLAHSGGDRRPYADQGDFPTAISSSKPTSRSNLNADSMSRTNS
jgi:hypothetical protein